MIRVGRARQCAVVISLCALLCGCLPPSDSQVDEQKEPHYIRGMNLVNEMDYNGAIEEFEKTLEDNPRNASARFELGWLYEDKADDPAAAIYNYNRYLKYSATQDKADLVKQHINSCKLELAKSVISAAPSGAQRELDRITIENRDLHSEVTNLQAQLAEAKSSLSKTQTMVSAQPVQQPPPRIAPRQSDEHPRMSDVTPLPKFPRTYVVKHGDTLAAIGRKYGVSLDALASANPRVKPTRLLVGQTLNIPSQ